MIFSLKSRDILEIWENTTKKNIVLKFHTHNKINNKNSKYYIGKIFILLFMARIYNVVNKISTITLNIVKNIIGDFHSFLK